MNGGSKHLFGPVPSRRFGRSLGVDLVPFKTCSFDCIFCQLGRTTNKTVERREYVSVEEVTAELDAWLATGDAADYITLSGSGEPTLHAEFGRVIAFARKKTQIPVALLTNGTLLSDPEVREQAARADIVKISLSAWDQESLNRINRPHAEIAFENLIEGFRRMRRRFPGRIWMEVFLVGGMNTAPAEVAAMARLARQIGPERIHCNTAVRPPCEEHAVPVSRDRMTPLAALFDPAAEIIAEFEGGVPSNVRKNESDVLRMIERRPCTLDQICGVFGFHRNEAAKYVGKLMRTNMARQIRGRAATYYAGRRGGEDDHADL